MGKSFIKTLLSLSLIVCFASSGCLKTRAQLKEEGSDKDVNKPIAAEVKDVQPQGRYEIDEIKGEITRLTGRIEDVERQGKQANQGVSAEDLKKLENRMVELEQAQASMLETMKKAQASIPVPDQTELLEKGKTQFREGEFDQAIASFSIYLKNPRAKKAEEATFYRAEAYYELKQYKKAIVDYSKFPEKYTKSKRLRAALLKIGYSFDALGMKEDAKGFYQELVDKFPKSNEAKIAKKKLK
ncbi:MAG: hypothetical protein A3K03_02445 [Bdellovibrionales bacterium RIFOXYD1_FULL_44_7]|nr:MAG: hypothetical protein A3K03_02445 [Bdellovibrionales bacterium RIFOXYD1_FULL_44_7]